MAVYAIGDIQGCYNELIQLLEKINYNDDRDSLWFTGDLVNRGPDSLRTLRLIKNMGANASVVLGNHDLHLLATAYNNVRAGKKDTLDEILHAPDCEQLLEWLRTRPLLHVDPELDMAMVHAGIHPAWTLEKAQSLAAEVASVLNSDEHVSFYKHMYGDKPRNWSDKLNGWQRLRFITNVFTRMRYCERNGKTSMNTKGAPGTQPKGLHPWFEIKSRRSRNNQIVFGHWSTLALVKNPSYPNVHPIDTGCLWGGALTALRIDEKPYTRIAVDCPEAQKPRVKS